MKLLEDWLKEQQVSELVQDLIYDLVYLSLGDFDLLLDIYVKNGKIERCADGDFHVFFDLVVNYLDTKTGKTLSIGCEMAEYLFDSGYCRTIPYNDQFAIELFTPVISERYDKREFALLVFLVQKKVKNEWGNIQVGRFYEEPTCVWRVIRREV